MSKDIWVIVIFSLVFLGVAVGFTCVNLRLMANSLTTRAEVIRLDVDIDDEGGRTYAPEFVYSDAYERVFTNIELVYQGNPQYEVGDTIEIIYNLDRPSESRLNDFWSLWIFPILFGAFGLLMLSPMLVMLWKRVFTMLRI